MRVPRVQCSTAEVSIATIGVLLMNADSGAQMATILDCAAYSPRGLPSTQSPIQRIAPVVLSAATSTKSTATVRTPGFQKPARASAGARMPLPTSTATAPTSTLSGVKRSHSSRPSVASTTPIVAQPCQSSPSNMKDFRAGPAAPRRDAPALRGDMPGAGR